VSDAERPRIRVRAENGRLVPLSQWDQEQIDKLPRGACIAEIDEEQAEDALRAIYMIGIKALYDNTPESGPGGKFPTETQLRRHIMRANGFCEPIHHRIDGVKMEAVSMAKGKMNYADMSTLLELSRTYAVERWGFDPWQKDEDK
jgi:hypothetical protein